MLNGVCDLKLIARDGIYSSRVPMDGDKQRDGSIIFGPIPVAGRIDVAVKCNNPTGVLDAAGKTGIKRYPNFLFDGFNIKLKINNLAKPNKGTPYVITTTNGVNSQWVPVRPAYMPDMTSPTANVYRVNTITITDVFVSYNGDNTPFT